MLPGSTYTSCFTSSSGTRSPSTNTSASARVRHLKPHRPHLRLRLLKDSPHPRALFGLHRRRRRPQGEREERSGRPRLVELELHMPEVRGDVERPHQRPRLQVQKLRLRPPLLVEGKVAVSVELRRARCRRPRRPPPARAAGCPARGPRPARGDRRTARSTRPPSNASSGSSWRLPSFIHPGGSIEDPLFIRTARGRRRRALRSALFPRAPWARRRLQRGRRGAGRPRPRRRGRGRARPRRRRRRRNLPARTDLLRWDRGPTWRHQRARSRRSRRLRSRRPGCGVGARPCGTCVLGSLPRGLPGRHVALRRPACAARLLSRTAARSPTRIAAPSPRSPRGRPSPAPTPRAAGLPAAPCAAPP